MDIPDYVQDACDRDRLSEPFMDTSTRKWFAFPAGGVMAIEIESSYHRDMALRREHLNPIALDLERSSERLAMIRHLSINPPNRTGTEDMQSYISLHFPGKIGEGLLFYAKNYDVQGIIIDGRLSAIQLRSSAEKAMHWLNHKLGRWIFEFDEQRNQVLIPTFLATESQERLNQRMADYPEINNSKIMEIESFSAHSIQQVHLQYPSIRGLSNRILVVVQGLMSINYIDASIGTLYEYQYELAYKHGFFFFERVLES